MQEPLQTPPPIPSPVENLPPSVLSQEPRDWTKAPKVVKSWAYQLTWLAIVLIPIVILVQFFSDKQDVLDRVIVSVVYGLLWCVAIYLNSALKKGARGAWTVQLILSCIGLIGFPVGTLIHGYILSQWFKPETKAWFGVQ